MALLRRGDPRVLDVCDEVGCASLGTFTTRFTELVGVSPGVYRQRTAGTTTGIPACVVKQVTRPVRNREAAPRTRVQVGRMDISIHYAFLPHTDGDAALGFYRDVLGFEVRKDVALFGRLQSSGVDVLQEPIEQEYGERDCAVRDPAGNLLRINQRR